MKKPYLIMLPGWGMKDCVWNRISGYLSKDFELIFIDWTGVDSLNGFQNRVVDVLDKKKISSFSLLGWSLGSLTALEIASGSQFDIKQLILFGGTSSFVIHREDGYQNGWDSRIVERMQSLLYKNTRETLHDFYGAMFSEEEKRNSFHTEFLEMADSRLSGQPADFLALGLDYLIRTDLRDRLADIKVPVLMVHGGKDSICPLKAALHMKDNLKHATVSVIKDAGHVPFFTAPSLCYDAVSMFVEENYNCKEDAHD